MLKRLTIRRPANLSNYYWFIWISLLHGMKSIKNVINCIVCGNPFPVG